MYETPRRGEGAEKGKALADVTAGQERQGVAAVSAVFPCFGLEQRMQPLLVALLLEQKQKRRERRGSESLCALLRRCERAPPGASGSDSRRRECLRAQHTVRAAPQVAYNFLFPPTHA